ncbi:MAG: CoA transferase [Polyangiaceae bacterium]|nr:CoA transferase [Polyangiaceae bacterium]
MNSTTEAGSAADRSAELWSALRGAEEAHQYLELYGPPALSSAFDVSGLAADSIGVASLAVAELASLRSGVRFPEVIVSRLEASAAFRCESLQAPEGWPLPPSWDPIAGNYRAQDRWIRLHTNYKSHRDAVLSVLGVTAEREAVAAAVSRWEAEALEQAVVDAGGAAACMYARGEWLNSDVGRATAQEPPVALLERGVSTSPLGPLPTGERGGAPLAGVRVLDLTRVIAGPLCTRFLAAYGADVLRVDPTGFEEVPALLPETTIGKRRCFLDLHTPAGKQRLRELVAAADALVVGLRPGALERFGLDAEALRDLNPNLVVAELDAYGWRGPWCGRRGFDSLVQMSCGITAHGSDAPGALPAQALDHAAGYLLAAGVCRALSQRMRGELMHVRASLLGVANHLWSRPIADPTPRVEHWPDELFERAETAWGPVRRVRCPGKLSGISPAWTRTAGNLGSDAPSFGDG